MITIDLLKQVYGVKGLPQEKSREIVALVKQHSGSVTDIVNSGNEEFDCQMELPPHTRTLVQDGLAKICGDIK